MMNVYLECNKQCLIFNSPLQSSQRNLSNTQDQKQEDGEDEQYNKFNQKPFQTIKCNQSEKLHVGDSGISDSSFQMSLDYSKYDLQNKTSNYESCQNVQNQEIQVQCFSQTQESQQAQEKQNQVLVNQKQQIKNDEQIKSITQVFSKVQLQRINNEENQDTESKNKSAGWEKEEKIESRTNNIWFNEELIYEKDTQTLNKKMTTVFQKQNIFDQTNVQKQNFQKAAKIINKLLNNSINRVMRIRQHVQNFIKLLKLRKSNKDISDLNEKDFVQINDLSYFYKQQIKDLHTNFLYKCLNQIFKFTKMIPIFLPTNTLRVIWDLSQVVFTYLYLYFYSIFMFFDQDEPDTNLIIRSSTFAFFLFLIDFFINLNTAYFDRDSIITKRKLIAKYYIFSTEFVTDQISLLVLGIKMVYQKEYIYNPDHNLLRYAFNFLIFLKLNGLSSKQQRFHYVFILKEYQKHIVRLFNQIASVITAAHIAAIGWYFVSIQERLNGYPNNWLDEKGLQANLYYEKYIYSIYWSITTMTTVGYGDIAATNYVEALYIAINMIIFSCIFAYSINNIGIILQEIERSSKQLNDNLSTIQRYLHRKKVSISLKSRVRHYLSFLESEQKDRDKKAEDQIMQILSNKLREEIKVEINTKILNNCHIFSSNFSQSTLNKLIFKMEEVLVSPNEIIFMDDEYEDLSVYFIQNGIIEIHQKSLVKQGKARPIQTLTDNQMFGELSFFSGTSRKASARSVNLSTLYKIKREDFIQTIKESNEDFERFKMMQEQIIFQNDLSVIHSECYICKQPGHIARQCHKIHQYFDKHFIALKQNFSQFQERNQKERSKITQRAYQMHKQNKNIHIQLKENLENLNSQIFQMFNSDQDFQDSEFSSSDQDNDVDEDDFSSESQSLSEEPNQVKSVQKSCKSMRFNKRKATVNQQNNLEKETRSSQEFKVSLQSQNYVYESQDFKVQNSKNTNSQVKSQSDENINNNNNSNSQINTTQLEQLNKCVENNDSVLVFNTNDINQSIQNNNENEDTKLQLMTKKTLQKQVQNQHQNSNQEHEKSKQKKRTSIMNNSNNQFQGKSFNKTSSKQFEDQINSNIQEYQNQKISQAEKNCISNQYVQRTSNLQTNQDFNDQKNRCSIENMVLHAILSNNLIQFNKLTNQQIKPGNTQIYQNEYHERQNTPNQEHSSRSVNAKSNSMINIQNKNSILKENQPNSQRNLNNIHSSNNVENLNAQMAQRLSYFIQNSNLPVLLQLTSGMSFRNTETNNPALSMDFFDKMCIFKKFFTNNNFDKVISHLKTIQLEQKRLRKQKMALKPRRQNIVFRVQTFQSLQSGKILFQKNTHLDTNNVNQDKPSHLLYGVGYKEANTIPIRQHNQKIYQFNTKLLNK